MDPNTGRFHRIETELEAIAEGKGKGWVKFDDLKRTGWVKFAVGELVAIKGQQFRVVDIGETHVVLRSVASENREAP